MSDIQNNDASVEPATPSITQDDSEVLGAPRSESDNSAAKDPED